MDEGRCQNELVKAHEEEEGVDLLNDETFGDFGSDDWENEHELFAKVDIPTQSIETSQHHDKVDLDLSIAHDRHDYNVDDFELNLHEDDMEKQLRRLVLDEVDEDYGAKCLAHNKANAYTKQYDMWADNLDFIRGSQHLPTNGVKFHDRSNHLGTWLYDIENVEDQKRNGQVKCGVVSGNLGKNAMTVEEVEKMLMMPGDVPSNQVRPKMAPSPFPPPPTLPFPLMPQPEHQTSRFQRVSMYHQGGALPSFSAAPEFLTHEHLRMQHYQHQQQSWQPFQQKQQLPILLQRPHQQQSMLPQNTTMLPHPNFPRPLPMSLQQHQILQHHGISPHPHMLPQHQVMLQQHMMLQQQQQRLQLEQQQHQVHLQQQLLPQQRLQQFPLHLQQRFQQQQMMMMMAEQARNAPYNHHNFSHSLPHHSPQLHLQRWQQNQFLLPQHKIESERREASEYDGLMDQREKDWIIKIQLIQLHTDNPYVDDYYFTCWSMKKLMRENLDKKKKQKIMKNNENGIHGDADNNTRGVSDDDDDDSEVDENVPTLLVPQLAKSENKRYTPAQYEGSLGKLTASSIHNPRQIIDVRPSSVNDDNKKQDSKKLKELLSKIEKAFDILLQVDDIEKKALALPAENRWKCYDERKELIGVLSKRLLKDNATCLQQALSLRKGAMLVVRLLPLVVELETTIEILCKVFEKLGAISKKDWKEEISPKIFQSVTNPLTTADLATLTRLSEAIGRNLKGEGLNNHMTQVLQSQLGTSVVFLLIDKLENLLQITPNNNNENQSNVKKWSSFVLLVARCLSLTNESSLPKPFKISLGKSRKCREPVGRSFVDSVRRFVGDYDGDGDELIRRVTAKMEASINL